MIKKRKLEDRLQVDTRAIRFEKKNNKAPQIKKPDLPTQEPVEQKMITRESTTYKKGRKWFWMKAAIFLICCFVIGRARGGIFTFMKGVTGSLGNIGNSISLGARNLIGNAIGTEPKKDENGNINMAVLGYGGDAHAGGYLTDAIILISVNPKAGTMSMLSLPRDMWVKRSNGGYGKLNTVFQSEYFGNGKNFEEAGSGTLAKLTEITGIPLSYYAFIDFDGFKEFIDTIGGVEIDVPEPIYDSAYPGANNSYVVFSIDSGLQTLDGETALKYTRSRHSTSDYSRSMRQQLVIDAVVKKLAKPSVALTPGKIEETYNEFTKFVHTNATLDEMLWAVPFAKSINHKSSWQLAVCGGNRRESMQPGCLLYTPPMDAMGGASTQIPSGATPSNPSNYSVVHSYVKDVVMNTPVLQEQATIRVQNGLTTGANRSIGNTPLANNIAVAFVKEGFTIFDVGNAYTGTYAHTLVTTNGKGWTASLEKIKRRLPESTIIQEGPIVPDGPSITVILGDDMVVDRKVYTSSVEKPLYLKY